MNKTTIRIAGFENESIVDGPGLRNVLFVQGCPHQCPHCHNPETHDPLGGVTISIREIAEKLTSNPLVHAITFSGGEPFVQSRELTQLAAILNQKGFQIGAYTGYLFEDLLRDPGHTALLGYLDFLVDGPFIYEQRTLSLPFRGSSNQRIIDVPQSLQSGKTILYQI